MASTNTRRIQLTAVAALAAAAAVAFVGLVYSPLRVCTNYAWFVGFLVSFIVYLGLTGRAKEFPRVTKSRVTSHGAPMDSASTIKPDIFDR